MEKAIYPEVKKEVVYINELKFRVRVTLETYLRKKHEGMYFFWKVWKQYEYKIDELDIKKLIDVVNAFHEDVYRSLILGKVDLNTVRLNHMGPAKPLFEMDSDQRSEEERLIPEVLPGDDFEKVKEIQRSWTPDTPTTETFYEKKK